MNENEQTDKRIGIEAFLDKPDGRPDLFEADMEAYYHFPCGECIHRTDDGTHCRGCRHYVL